MTRYYLAAALTLVTFLGRAQNPGSGGPQPSAPTPTDVPVDGGTSLLLVSGVAYGLQCLR